MNDPIPAPLDPKPWALLTATGIEIDRHATPRTASEFYPRPGYEQDIYPYGVSR